MSYILVLFISISIMVSATSSLAQIQGDAFQEMLRMLNLSETNLGFRPKGYWTRYPDPAEIPYKNLVFDDLFAEPHRIYDFVRLMALSVNDFLHPQYLAANHNALYKVSYYCGIRNATTQFRGYSASLWAELASEEPLLNAIKEMYTRTHTVYRYNAMGQASDFPLIEKDLRTAIAPIHPEIQKVIARTVLHLLDAYRFCQIGMRNVDWKDATACWRIRHLGETQFDGLEYYPQLEDAARAIDLNSIYYAGQKMLESAELLVDSLLALKSAQKIDWNNQELNIITPMGRIVIAGARNNMHQYSDAFVVVDLGGDDSYHGAIGATPSLNIPVALAVDLAGNDKYMNEDEFVPSQGAAIFGAGVLLDVAGNDDYHSRRLSQGAAMLGLGVLADLDGDDNYQMWTMGQGGACFGIGIAIDNTGDDTYTIWGDGQGYGGVGGVGTLINRTGNDHYYAEPAAAKVFRPDFHSKDSKLNYSYAQGCGVGRRGDITDGHSWAGGMGTLIDLAGNDRYESGNWSLGCGYWYGMGFVYDGAGADTYKSASWTQAAGAHFCIGALFDDGGADKHICWAEQSVGLGFGHDYTIALLLNRDGDDWYQLKDDGLGFAINMSQVFFFDTNGNDCYITGENGRNFGWNNFDQNNPPGVTSMYHLYSDQVCFFADIAGTDTYLRKNYSTGKELPDLRMSDGNEIFCPATKDSLANKRYYGLGKDFINWPTDAIEYFRDKMKRMFSNESE